MFHLTHWTLSSFPFMKIMKEDLVTDRKSTLVDKVLSREK